MGLFGRKNKKEKNTMPKSQQHSANQLNEDDLLSIAGGQDFHSKEEEQANLDNTLNVTNRNK